jgi:hypothetical protein
MELWAYDFTGSQQLSRHGVLRMTSQSPHCGCARGAADGYYQEIEFGRRVLAVEGVFEEIFAVFFLA